MSDKSYYVWKLLNNSDHTNGSIRIGKCRESPSVTAMNRNIFEKVALAKYIYNTNVNVELDHILSSK